MPPAAGRGLPCAAVAENDFAQADAELPGDDFALGFEEKVDVLRPVVAGFEYHLKGPRLASRIGGGNVG